MSTIISNFSNPSAWNNLTQRLLSQSNNVSYSTRGAYRVSDTEPDRKGDYWFRDFGMVMACAYMTEFGFRGVDALYTIPLITKELELNNLANKYPGAINYPAMPDVFRNRVMGSLIRSSSSDLVPKLMKDLELKNASNLKIGALTPEENQATQASMKKILESPSVDEAGKEVDAFLQNKGLDNADTRKAIRNVVAEQNPARREALLKALVKDSPNAKALTQAVKLEHARQMHILAEHLQINMNFTEHVKSKYLDKDIKLSESVTNVLKDFAEKTNSMYDKQNGDKLGKMLDEVWYLPQHQQEKEFNKRFKDFQDGLYLKEWKPIATKGEREQFDKLGQKFRDLLKEEAAGTAEKSKLQGVVGNFKAFYENLGKNKDAHEAQLFSYLGPEIRENMKEKIEDTVNTVAKAGPEKDRMEELGKKLDELTLTAYHSEEEIQKFKDELKPHLTSKEVSEKGMKSIKDSIKSFTEKLTNEKNTLQDTLHPLLNSASKTIAEKDIKQLISQAIHSKAAMTAVSKVQKSSTWPKTFSTVLLNLVFYGYLASNFDNKVLQPYQQKLVEERGTSQDIVNAGYLGLIPGAAVLSQFFDTTALPMFKKMGHFTRFATVGGLALGTFAGSSYLILQQLLKNPPKNPPKSQFQPLTGSPTRPAFNNPTGAGANPFSPFASASRPSGFTPGGLNAFAVPPANLTRS